MDNSVDSSRIRWAPFYALLVITVIASGFWKLEKSREEPLKPMELEAPQAARPAPSPMEGKPAPQFSLTTIDGKPMRLADYRGKVVFLNIWATWCPPCKQEMPSMQALYEHFKGKDFAMLTISIDEKKEDVPPFMKELGLTFPVAVDPEQKVVSQYGITGVPETYIIDKEGVITHHIVGPGEWNNPGIINAFEGLVSRPAKAGQGA
ncbi:MAG: TlpA family protein disulfide reductase [Nitrospinae bacterium]|nr:TlpA family protein disulfide reductase [Nitrospinota bacterium]